MATVPRSVNESLWRSARLPPLSAVGPTPGLAEWLALVGLGAASALLVALVDLPLRVPGHAILRAVFPTALGFALAPRRMAGTVMGSSAGVTLFGMGLMGAGVGWGATTSACLLGPILDAALYRAQPGWGLYLRFAAAGMVTNLLAFASRWGAKTAGWEGGGKRLLAEWWPQAIGTYAACGLLAGLVSAIVWFRLRPVRTSRGHTSI